MTLNELQNRIAELDEAEYKRFASWFYNDTLRRAGPQVHGLPAIPDDAIPATAEFWEDFYSGRVASERPTGRN